MDYPYVRDVRGVVLYVREHGSGQWVAGPIDRDDNFAEWCHRVKAHAMSMGCRLQVQRADGVVLVWDIEQGPPVAAQLAMMQAVEASASDEPLACDQPGPHTRRDHLRVVRNDDV